jgi:hypothetical protein
VSKAVAGGRAASSAQDGGGNALVEAELAHGLPGKARVRNYTWAGLVPVPLPNRRISCV